MPRRERFCAVILARPSARLETREEAPPCVAAGKGWRSQGEDHHALGGPDVLLSSLLLYKLCSFFWASMPCEEQVHPYLLI